MGCSASTSVGTANPEVDTPPTVTASINSNNNNHYNNFTPTPIKVPLPPDSPPPPRTPTPSTPDEDEDEVTPEATPLPAHIFYGGEGLHVEGTIGPFLLEQLRQHAGEGRIAQLDADSGLEWSYEELLTHSVRVAKVLEQVGLGPGDTVAVFAWSYHEVFGAVLGGLFAGTTIAAMMPTSTVADMIHQLRLVKPRVLMTEPNLLPVARGALATFPLPIILISVLSSPDVPEGVQTLESFLESSAASETDVSSYEAVAPNPEDHIAFVLYSSGTTGLPKGVCIPSHGLLQLTVNNGDFANHYDQTFLNTAPMSWVSGVWALTIGINVGLKRVFMPAVTGPKLVRCIMERQIRRWATAPSVIMAIYANPAVPDGFLEGVTAMVGGATMSTQMFEKVQTRFKAVFRNVYGITEGGFIFMANENDPPGVMGHIQKLVSLKVVNVDTEEDVTEPHVTGELRIKGPCVMKGYVGNPKATADAFDQNGWLRSGDIVYFDEDGNFYYVDRIKEMIKYRSYQVAPSELEAVLMQHPGVKAACVVGRPNEIDDEWPAAFVALKDGAEVTTEELHAKVNEQLADQKRLRGGIYFVDVIPTNISGKMLRRELKAKLSEYPVPEEAEPRKVVKRAVALPEYDTGESLGNRALRFLRLHAKTNKIAQQCGHSGESMTYKELLENVVHFAVGIRTLGVETGETVALLARNYHQLYVAVLGGVIAGITIAPSVPNSSPAELAHHLALTTPRYILAEEELMNVARNAVDLAEASLAQKPHIISFESEEYLEILVSGAGTDVDSFQAARIEDRADHVPFILYSSGTTGLAKGVMLSDQGITTQLQQLRKAVLDVRDVLLCSSPMSWISAQPLLFSGIEHGTNRVFVRDSEPEFILGVLDKYKVQSWMSAPTVLRGVSDALEAEPGRWDITPLTNIMVGGAIMEAETQERLSRVLAAKIQQVYGCTESGFITTGEDPRVKMGSAGLPAHYLTLQVVDVGTEEVITEPNRIGELRAKPVLMKAYVGNPEETAKAFDSQQRYKSGDLGYFDEDGNVFIVDRIKEMIKYRGYQIPPAELEGLLLQNAGVADVCVLGKPHPVDGDHPTAFVVRAPGSTITEDEIKEIISNTLSDAKKLRGGVYFVDAMLRTATGKTDRKNMKEKLREMTENELSNDA